VPVLWDVGVIFFSSIVVLTLNGIFWVVPLYSESDMTADNAYRNLDATIKYQGGTIPNESNLQSQGHLSPLLHIYLF
jgi:hypothetical protein